MSYTRSAIITGGTLNLGYNAALDIARRQPDCLVVICSRSDKEKAADSINQTLKQKNTIFLPLDLSDPKTIRDFAKDWSSKDYPPIQTLLLNAALQFPNELVLTKEGIEATFAITHVGHALLFHLLFPHLSPTARVVVTASGVHDPAQKTGLPDAKYVSAEQLAHPPPEVAKGSGLQHYTNSKLANILWVYATQRNLRERNPESAVTINAFDPGLMFGTGLVREAHPVFRFLWNYIFPWMIPIFRVVYLANIHTASESGASLGRLAASDEMVGVSGKYFEGRKEIESSKDSYDVSKQDDLWKWTVKYCAQNEEQAERFERFQ